ncbi:hypothetical protein [Streptomyces purpureus]|uniref:hypothetical protein n=1 Tax=Streptomyces purpureus TaxID=1951 RepID=UPI000361BE0D|nr:hypothetical protein [Streptomyces purpureus]
MSDFWMNAIRNRAPQSTPEEQTRQELEQLVTDCVDNSIATKGAGSQEWIAVVRAKADRSRAASTQAGCSSPTLDMLHQRTLANAMQAYGFQPGASRTFWVS